MENDTNEKVQYILSRYKGRKFYNYVTEEMEEINPEFIKSLLRVQKAIDDGQSATIDSVDKMYDAYLAKSVMDIAWQAAGRGECIKKQVGAAFAQDKKILSVGYGGSELNCNSPLDLTNLQMTRRFDFEGEERCIRKDYEWTHDSCWSIHAEMRALLDYVKIHGFDIRQTSKGTMYTTHGPCDQCLKYLQFFGIKKVIFAADYKTDYSKWTGLIDIYQLVETESGPSLILQNPEQTI